jgi:hypothetical protein
MRVIKSRMEKLEYVAYMEKNKNTYKIFAGKLKGEETIWKLWSKWEDNIKMDLNNWRPHHQGLM